MLTYARARPAHPAATGAVALFTVLLALLMALPIAATAQSRVAFLVGNADYQYTASLDNPIADVELIAATLRDLDFEVRLLKNLTRKQIGRELTKFLRETEGAAVTMFYFAGHGMQLNGVNYLIGVDAQLATELDVASEALNLDSVVDLLERNSRAAMVFVDACRNNPLADRFYRENYSQTRALMTRGLAPVKTAFEGTMLTFSAAPGQVAYDGEVNSPFAIALARHLPANNIEVLSAMKRVIRDVKSMTGDLQTPMVVNDLTTEIYLNLGTGDAGAGIAYDQEQAMFDAALQMQSPRAWSIYFKRFPNGFLRDMAMLERDRLATRQLAEQAGVEVVTDASNGVQIAAITPEVAATAERALGLSRDETKAVQAALNGLGYKAGPVDGALGQKSRRAIANFQLKVGLPSTGVVTQATAEALGVSMTVAESSATAVYSSRDARRYDPEKLALIESDTRLLKAVKALQRYDLVYGFYDGRVYIAANLWRNPSWDEAVALAERAGGHLATLTTADENKFALDLVKYDDRFWGISRKWKSTSGPSFGLSQSSGAREPYGGWSWVTGEPFAFSDWIPGQPNNWEGIEDWANFQSNKHIPGNTGEIDQGWRNRAGWDDLPNMTRSLIIEIE